jgi:hypothetical protein
MQPLQYDLRNPATQNNSITHAAAAPSNLDPTTTIRFAEIELQKIIKLLERCRKLDLQDRISTPKQKKTILKHFLD